MLKQTFTTLAAIAVLTALPMAQTKPAATQPTPPPATPQSEKPAVPETRPAEPYVPVVNVRIELTITDQLGPGEPSRKVVTMVVANRANANIRTSGRVLVMKEGWRDVNINVDAKPFVYRDGTIQLEIGLQYQPTGSGSAGATDNVPTAQTGLNERITTILESGKPLIISQAADPASERRIGVEVKATIMK
jgi:hypothetical protein